MRKKQIKNFKKYLKEMVSKFAKIIKKSAFLSINSFANHFRYSDIHSFNENDYKLSNKRFKNI